MRIGEYIQDFRLRCGRTPTVGLVGLGTSNLAILGELIGIPTVIRSHAPLNLSALPPSALEIGFHEGEQALFGIYEDILVLSPSVRRDKRELREAQKRGTILTSDAELFFDGHEAAVWAVTGSDGKSTTATLAAMLLSEKYPDVELLGNIGTPFSTHKGGAAVAELSSFQLLYTEPKSEGALITPLTPNHLDWHLDLDEYVSAKLNIFKHAKRRVSTPDTQLSDKLASEVGCDIMYSTKLPCSELMHRYRAEHFITLERGSIMLDGKELIPTSACKRREIHNIHNLMGAIALTLGECSGEHIHSVAADFSGLEHRCEHFLSAGGIDFINSSIDTTPSRTASTLSSLGRRVRLILGGKGKQLSLSPCIPLIERYADRISLYGETADEYLAELRDSRMAERIECKAFTYFDAAIEHALSGISEGDTLLLSPAATGYGEFHSFAERGTYFKKYITDKYKTH